MSNSNRPHYQLTVDSQEPGVVLTLFNDDREICTNKLSAINIKLPRGLYTLRAERNGQFQDKMIRLANTQTVQPNLPERYTAMTLPGAFTSHEYYTYNAWKFSQESTVNEIVWQGEANSSLMLFIRAPNRDLKERESQTQSLVLRAPNGQVLSDFDENQIEHDPDAGFTAFSAKMSPGIVILEDYGRHPRQINIPLLTGFQTQIFVMHRGRPLFEDMRIVTVPQDDILSRAYRDPYTKDEFATTNDFVDIGMSALQNNVGEIGQDLVKNFLNSKYQNPVLGLLGAYLMLLRRHQSVNQKFTNSLPDLVINNLENLMPDSADIIALRYLAQPWLELKPFKPIKGIPMFRVGAEVLIEASAKEPALIPEGSLLDIVSDRIMGDSAWTSWEPILLPPSIEDIELNSGDTETLGWVELAIADAIGTKKGSIDTSSLALQIGVTQRSIRSSYNQLLNKIDQKPELITDFGHDFNTIRYRLDALIDSNRLEMHPRIILEDIATNLTNLRTNYLLTYQGVYPQVKNTIAALAHTKKKILASDKIRTFIVNQEIDLLRLKLTENIKHNYPSIKLADLHEDFSNAKTVRDIANLVIKKEGL